MATEIKVNSDDLRALATYFREKAAELDPVLNPVSNITVNPGSDEFIEAKELKVAIEKRAADLKLNGENLKKALTAIANKLDSIAAKYDSAEELNTVDAQEVSDLTKSIDEYVP